MTARPDALAAALRREAQECRHRASRTVTGAGHAEQSGHADHLLDRAEQAEAVR